MVETVTNRNVAGGPSAEGLVQAFRWMLLARSLDEKMANLYRGGKIHGGVFLGRGQEALSVSIGMVLKPGDVFGPLIRDLAGRLAFGETVLDAARTYLGSALGPMRGRDGNIHRGRPNDGTYAMISHLGSMISVINGALMARRMQGRTGCIGATCIGDGGTSTGAFHEAINQAAIEKLPLILVVADNQYAYSTPRERQFACANLLDKAVGYGVAGHAVDGTDLKACIEVMSTAAANARVGQGPQLVVANLLRLCGHGEHDDASYVDPKLRQSKVGRDCLTVAEEQLLSGGLVDATQIERWRAEIQREIEEAVAKVQREPTPDPFQETWQALSNPQLLDYTNRA